MQGKTTAGYNVRQSAVFIKKLIKVQIIITYYKFNIDVVDLWNNEKLKDMCLSGEINSYMKTKYGTENEPDPIHPNATGYKELWTPVFEETLSEILK